MRENVNDRITKKNNKKRIHKKYGKKSDFSYLRNIHVPFYLNIVLFLFLLVLSGKNVQAASGSIYTCKMNPSYSHPVTGQIEDAGGSSSTTTGQGMVEGAIGSKGILEVTDHGEYYLTFQLGLMDYSSKQSFGVQSINASGWNTVSATITGNGSDSSGKTADMRIQVPSESCIVRCSMYVEPMGRNVIFYFYPSDYTVGNSTRIKAEIVTQSSSETKEQEKATTEQKLSESTEQASVSGKTNESSLAQGTGQADSPDTSSELTEDSSIQNKTAEGSTSTEDALKDTQGLALSTASDIDASESEKSSSSGIVEIILAVCVGITISGLILLFTGAYIVYIFRKNWKRWGAGTLYLNPEEQIYPEETVYMAEDFGEPDTENDMWDYEVEEEEFHEK